MIVTTILAYIIIGTLLAEVCRYICRQKDGHVTAKQYFNLVFLWPVCIYIASKRW